MSIYDVVIAGYGPTGAVVANLLGAQGHNVLVVEPELEIYEIPRAVHFDGEIMRIFQQLGLAAEIEKLSAQGVMLKFINGRDWTLFQQDLRVIARHHAWFNNLFFDQPRLEKCLRSGVARYPNVQVRLGWQLTEIDFQSNEDQPFDFLIAPCEQVTREHKSEKLTTRYLMACDGASSPTRKLLDIQQEDLQCDEPWLVCDLKLGEGVSYDRTALQICDPKQPASLIPCESDHIRWEFMLNKNFDVDKIEEESCVRGLMANHLHRLGPHIKSTDGELIRAKVYNFHALIAERFQAGNIFLLGDAAHQMPPFLGQGMCAGIRDAHNLCWKLSGVLAGKFAPRILDTYSTERLPQVRRIIETAIAHGAIIQTRNPVKAFIRDSYLMLGRLFPILVGFLKFGESWQLGDGLFISDTKTGLRRPVAEPLPQSLISSNSFDASEPSFLSDELLSDKFTVIGFGIDPRTLTLDWEKLAWLDVLCIGLKGHFQEVQGELMRWATENQIAVAVVRPDRQIYGFCGKDAQLDAKLSVVINRLAKSLE